MLLAALFLLHLIVLRQPVMDVRSKLSSVTLSLLLSLNHRCPPTRLSVVTSCLKRRYNVTRYLLKKTYDNIHLARLLLLFKGDITNVTFSST